MSASIEIKNGDRCLAARVHGSCTDSLAISCHGMLSTKDGDKHVMLAAELERLGVATCRFDFSGRGESQGSLFDLSYSTELTDVQAVIEHFAHRGVQRFALFGSSMGGAVALLAAARDERIVAVATLAAVAHTELIDERHPEEARSWHQLGYVDTPAGRIGRAFYDDALAHDVLSAVRIVRAPILVLHGDRDEIVPVSDAHDIASTARNASLDIVYGADHRFSNPVHLRPALRCIASFLAASLLT